MKTYPMGDTHSKKRFVKTDEFRNPKKGEFFLSGAIIEAYQAPNDLSSPYWIAKEVNASN